MHTSVLSRLMLMALCVPCSISSTSTQWQVREVSMETQAKVTFFPTCQPRLLQSFNAPLDFSLSLPDGLLLGLNVIKLLVHLKTSRPFIEICVKVISFKTTEWCVRESGGRCFSVWSDRPLVTEMLYYMQMLKLKTSTQKNPNVQHSSLNQQYINWALIGKQS